MLTFRAGNIFLVTAFLMLFLAGCQSAGEKTEQSVSYDQSSWKTMIAESCATYFDGCNTCRRAPGSNASACSRKACGQYQKPQCLDDRESQSLSGKSPVLRVNYICENGNTFTVYYGEYGRNKNKQKLGENQVMLSDAQKRRAYLLTRAKIESGVQYTNDNLMLSTMGKKAVLTDDNQLLYYNCAISP